MATITEIAGTKQQKKILRTAAYCRVSSDSLDQLHSFASQVQHYTKAISQNPSMELADIYADEGLTGTKTDKRDDFNRLIADCRKGKIDRVLTEIGIPICKKHGRFSYVCQNAERIRRQHPV